MKTARFLGIPCAALALFALPAAAQTGGLTPATNDTCDFLADDNPGLYGVCVALCEAQNCEGTLNPDGTVTFDDTCEPSADELLRNYVRLARGSEEELPPCIEPACPCFSEIEINNIGGYTFNGESFDRCSAGPNSATLRGYSTDGNPSGEQARALNSRFAGRICIGQESNPPFYRQQPVSDPEYAKCRESIIEECAARGIDPSVTN